MPTFSMLAKKDAGWKAGRRKNSASIARHEDHTEPRQQAAHITIFCEIFHPFVFFVQTGTDALPLYFALLMSEGDLK